MILVKGGCAGWVCAGVTAVILMYVVRWSVVLEGVLGVPSVIGIAGVDSGSVNGVVVAAVEMFISDDFRG